MAIVDPSALTTLSNNKKSKEVSEGKQKSYMKFASLSIQLFQKIRPDADAEKKVIEQIMEIVTEYKSIAEKNYTTQRASAGSIQQPPFFRLGS